MLKKSLFYFSFINLLTFIVILIIAFSVTNSFGTALATDSGNLVKSSIYVNHKARTFYVYTPTQYNKDSARLPMVLVFHGSAADGKKIMNYTKFNKEAEKNNFIAVYPEKNDIIEWDLKNVEKSKEIPFISELIDFMTRNYKVDKSRVYATGFSSGAELSYILAGNLANKIAAFAPVCGNIRKNYAQKFKSSKPVPVLLIHGTEDPYEKWNGDIKKEMLSVSDSMNFLKTHNKCSQNQTEVVFPHKQTDEGFTTTAKLITNIGCTKDSEVSILEIDGGGHTWPGAPTDVKTETFLGKTNYDVDANDIIWEFFQRHQLN